MNDQTNSKVKRTEHRRQEKRKLSSPTHSISQVVLSILSLQCMSRSIGMKRLTQRALKSQHQLK